MSRTKQVVVSLVALAVVALVAWPVYAHCGKCASTAKEIVYAMDAGKTTLTAAIGAAETTLKGKAVSAYGEMEDGKLMFDVYCLVGEKIMKVEVDSAGKAGKSEEVKEFPVEHVAKPKLRPGG